MNELRVKIVLWHSDRGLDPVEDMKDNADPGSLWRHWFRNVTAGTRLPWKGSDKCNKKWRKNMNQRLKNTFWKDDAWVVGQRRKHSDGLDTAECKRRAIQREQNRKRSKRLYWKKKLNASMPASDAEKRELILDVLDDFEPDAELKLKAFNNISTVSTTFLPSLKNL